MSHLRSALSTIVVATLAAACGRDSRTQDEGEPGDTVGIAAQELLRQIEQSPCDEVPEPDSIVVDALTGGDTYENEVHDCQRLIMPDGIYGPLAALIPLDSAMQLSEAAFDSPVAVSSIVNWGRTEGRTLDYPELSITQVWSCLWLMRTGEDDEENVQFEPVQGADPAWRGAVAPAPPRGCAHAGPGDRPTDWNLDVVRMVHDSAAPGRSVYPPTARWGTDADGIYYMGVRCADAWCTVGVHGFEPADTVKHGGPVARSVPGWYDRQRLAVLEAGALRPGPWATLYPHPGHPASAGETAPPVFRFFADIEVVRDPSDPVGFEVYRKKFNLRVVGDTGYARIRLIRRASNAAPTATYLPGALGSPPPSPPDTVAQADTVIFIPLTRHGANGSVRWRWLDQSDESAWMACEEGCCDVRSTKK